MSQTQCSSAEHVPDKPDARLTFLEISRTPLGLGQPDMAGIVSYIASGEGRWIANAKIRGDGRIG